MARMYIKTINGSTPPVPQSIEVQYFTVEKDSGANMAGTMIHNVIAHKIKFVLSYPPMTETTYNTLTAMMKPDELTIVYYDPFDGTEKTGYFYHGDIKIKPRWLTGASAIQGLFEVFDINLIEN